MKTSISSSALLPLFSICFPLGLVAASSALGFGCSSSNASPAESNDAATATDSSTTSTGSPDSSATSTDSSTPGSQDASSPDDSSTGVDAGPLGFSADIYGTIIEHHCVGCHGFTADGGEASGLAFGKLDMSSVDAGYANLVNVPAAGAACGLTDGGTSPLRVVPGSAATSLLWEKVNGYVTAPPCGEPMPKSGEIGDGGQAIVAAQIQTWINQGALP
jgi:hypothetical protein